MSEALKLANQSGDPELITLAKQWEAERALQFQLETIEIDEQAALWAARTAARTAKLIEHHKHRAYLNEILMANMIEQRRRLAARNEE